MFLFLLPFAQPDVSRILQLKLKWLANLNYSTYRHWCCRGYRGADERASATRFGWEDSAGDKGP
jgi:hypothetical protein